MKKRTLVFRLILLLIISISLLIGGIILKNKKSQNDDEKNEQSKDWSWSLFIPSISYFILIILTVINFRRKYFRYYGRQIYMYNLTRYSKEISIEDFLTREKSLSNFKFGLKLLLMLIFSSLSGFIFSELFLKHRRKLQKENKSDELVYIYFFLSLLPIIGYFLTRRYIFNIKGNEII